jgi:2-amino-4-hydroxy-6-hydroxymethyldihydropteridine diphosphokinase
MGERRRHRWRAAREKDDPCQRHSAHDPRNGSWDRRGPLGDNGPHVARAFVGLGSNLDRPEEQIRSALELLDAEEGIEVLAVSTLRETDPVGYEDQPRFVNGAAELATDLSPRELLRRLLAIERRLGRVRGQGPRYGPRTIDLDLLLYGAETLDEPGLTLPHPRLHERRFALEPLAELDPALEFPGRGPVQALLAGL